MCDDVGKRLISDVRPALEQQDCEALRAVLRQHWTAERITPLICSRRVDVRRVAAMSLGVIGTRAQEPALARALHDPDAQVNQLADHSLWSIWFRAGSYPAIKSFREGMACLSAEKYDCALHRFAEATRADPHFGEAYNQSAIAHFLRSDWVNAINYSRRTLALVPVHFGAAVGMGHCFVQLGQPNRALTCYRRALSINPRMAPILKAVQEIEESQRKQNDSSGTFDLVRT